MAREYRRCLLRVGRSRVLNSPGWLLLAVGGLLGCNFPLGKIASEAGIPGAIWAALISSGAAITLSLVQVLRGAAVSLDAHQLRYFLLTGVVSSALPNALVLTSIPRLGSGLTAMLFTLSPLFTALFSAVVGLRAPRWPERVGIGLGFIGAVLVATARGEVGEPARWTWLLPGLLIPVTLASGNVYRTLDWPDGADTVWLAAGTNVAAAMMLIVFIFATGDADALHKLLAAPRAAFAQVLVSSTMLLLFFRLQRVGGPVTLSQIGTVAAGVGVLMGVSFFDERYPPVTWYGVAVIAAGIAITIASRLRE